jgi:hypothetical protein
MGPPCLVEVEYQVKLADIVEVLIENLYKVVDSLRIEGILACASLNAMPH